jgi:hypothetical protein
MGEILQVTLYRIVLASVYDPTLDFVKMRVLCQNAPTRPRECRKSNCGRKPSSEFTGPDYFGVCGHSPPVSASDSFFSVITGH